MGERNGQQGSSFSRTAALCAALFVAACTPSQVGSVVPDRRQPTAGVAGATVPSGTVPAGTLLSARIDRAVDSFHTPPGTIFDATVVTPLESDARQTVVPYGAKVRGRVVSTGTPGQPRLVFAIDSMETAMGRVRAPVAVRRVQHVLWQGPPVPVPTRLVPSPGYLLEGVPAEERPPAEVYIPAGALMVLVLQQPLAAPTAVSTRNRP
jgi:hypothetical protein